MRLSMASVTLHMLFGAAARLCFVDALRSTNSRHFRIYAPNDAQSRYKFDWDLYLSLYSYPNAHASLSPLHRSSLVLWHLCRARLWPAPFIDWWPHSVGLHNEKLNFDRLLGNPCAHMAARRWPSSQHCCYLHFCLDQVQMKHARLCVCVCVWFLIIVSFNPVIGANTWIVYTLERAKRIGFPFFLYSKWFSIDHLVGKNHCCCFFRISHSDSK